MDREEIINFLRTDNSSAVFEHLHLNPEAKLMMYLRIDGTLAFMTVKKTANYDTFTVILEIPREFWSIQYINWSELVNTGRRPNYPPG